MSSQTPPPNHDTRAPGIVASAIALMAVSSVAVVLRLWSRYVANSLGLWWDDWSIVATLIFSHSFLAFTIYWTTLGLGKHAWMIPKEKVVPNDIASHVGPQLFNTALMMIKVSALLLYARMFKRDRKYRIALWVVGVIFIIIFIIGSIEPWMQCHPIHKDIDPFEKGHCVNNTRWIDAAGIINSVEDIVVLLFPMPMVWKLDGNFQKKMVVMMVFILGYSSAFLSFARFIIMVRDPSLLTNIGSSDPSWDMVPIVYLSMFESPVAIFALCGVPIGQLLSRLLKGKRSTSMVTSGWRTSQRSDADSSPSSEPQSDRKAWSTAGTSSAAAISDHFDKNQDDWQPPPFRMGINNVDIGVVTDLGREDHIV